jgi:hypothetical protein
MMLLMLFFKGGDGWQKKVSMGQGVFSIFGWSCLVFSVGVVGRLGTMVKELGLDVLTMVRGSTSSFLGRLAESRLSWVSSLTIMGSFVSVAGVGLEEVLNLPSLVSRYSLMKVLLGMVRRLFSSMIWETGS